jgi:hypothetical protein
MAKRGRPPISPSEGSTRVCFALPESLYDQAFQHAQASRSSVPDLIRRALARLLRDERGGPFSNTKSRES